MHKFQSHDSDMNTKNIFKMLRVCQRVCTIMDIQFIKIKSNFKNLERIYVLEVNDQFDTQ